MKWLPVIFLVFILLICFTKKISAHIVGQPPFFKVNEQYAGYYPVSLNSNFFTIPQDISPQNYLVGESINFEIDGIALQLPIEVISATRFDWDFGDGKKGSGVKNTHAYNKPGSYLLNVTANYKNDEPMLIESLLIQVLPDKNYIPPVAKIKVNEREIGDPLTDILKMDLQNDEFEFDASSSTSSSNITKYIWDFGDGTTSNEAIVKHKFINPDPYQQFIILRVEDEKGYYADTYVEISNKKGQDSETNLSAPTANDQNVSAKNASDVKKSSNNSPTIDQKQNLIFRTYLKFNLISRNYANQIFSGNATPLVWILTLVFIFIAGSFHALTPGHGKSMMAAFLVGKHDSKILDVLLLALSITLTHTFVIFLLGFIFIYLDQSKSLNDVMPYFEKLSAIVVVLLAFNLILSGIKNLKKQKSTVPHDHDHNHNHNHNHNHEHSRENLSEKLSSNGYHEHNGVYHSHTANLQNKDGSVSKRSLLLAGFSGGIIPCVDAFALLLLSVSVSKIYLGMILVLTFSIGMALTIVFLGLTVIYSKNRINFDDRLGKIGVTIVPILSGLFLLLISLSFIL